MEKTSSFILKYPENSGFDKTDIIFYSGTPELEKIYFDCEKTYPNRLFVTDTNIASLDCMKTFLSKVEANDAQGDRLLVLGAGEKYKTIESVLEIVKKALDANFNRNCVFVGIGGGVICDMTAFAASMFKRGVDVEFVSTTLLADVDASVGGKTGCDFESYKNMIGAFYPAKRLHVAPQFVKSLPEKEYISGLAEAIKTALLFSPSMTELLKTQKDKIMARDDEAVQSIITECAKAKAAIVQEDFKEKGNRAFLNYGHTFGHALESVSGLGEITHGEGVAWGMARAAELSLNLSLCSKEFAKDTIDLLESYGYDTKKAGENLKEKILSAMHKDKKNNSSAIRVILQSGPQQTIIKEVSDKELEAVI